MSFSGQHRISNSKIKLVITSAFFMCFFLLEAAPLVPPYLLQKIPFKNRSQNMNTPPPTKRVAGTVEGVFKVTNRGTAKYTIPIKTPPGRLGIEPRLSLEYNSDVKHGLAGLGWTLKGLSEIRRCGNNYAQDKKLAPMKFNSNDNFELDGNRLIEIHTHPMRQESISSVSTNKFAHMMKSHLLSREYRTERETFSKIISYGNPIRSFKVWTKDGKILTYGSKSVSGRSSIVWGKNRIARKWLLNTVEDRYGNSMSIRYYNQRNTQNGIINDQDRETVEYFPLDISYTYINNTGGTSKRMVQFKYITDNSSSRIGYHAGCKVRRGFLLSQIRSHISGEAGWQNAYFLNYEESPVSGKKRLQKIIETDGKGNYLHPTELVYSNGDLGWEKPIKTNVPYPTEKSMYSFPIDVNGDGYDDILSQGYTGNYSQFRLSLNNTSETNSSYDFPIPINLNIKAYILGPLDYNLDGLMDLAYFEISNNANYNPSIKIRLSTGDNFGPEIDTGIPTNIWDRYPLEVNNISDLHKLKYIHLVDLNGDKVQDILICRKGSDNQPHWYYYLHNGTGFGDPVRLRLTDDLENRNAFEHKLIILDYNGDGAMDVLLGHKYSHNDFSAFFVTGEESVAHTNLPTYPFRVLQNDNDNPLDLNTVENNNSRELNTEEDVDPEQIKWYELPVYRIMDHNGDGLQDIIVLANEEDTWRKSRLWINTGKGFKEKDYNVLTPSLPPMLGKNRRGVKVMDWDGDGRHDLLAPMAFQPSIKIGNKFIPVGHKKYRWYVLKSVQQGFKAVPTELPYKRGMIDYLKPGVVRTFDISGNLVPDILFEPHWEGLYNTEGVFWTSRNKRNLNDLLIEIHDHPYGGEKPWKVKIKYSNPVAPVYSNQQLEPVPDNKVINMHPMYPLVSSYKKDMGKGNTPAEFEYKYKDYRIDRLGRGELGFGELNITNKATGKVTIRQFDNYTMHEYGDGRYRYPYRGMITKEQTILNLGNARTHLTETTNIPDMKLYGNKSRYYPYLKNKIFNEYELYNHNVHEPIDQITDWNTSYILDEWGNTTKYKKEYSNNIYDEITTNFTNNTSKWLIGKPITTVQKSVVGSEIKARRTEYQYHPETGFLQYVKFFEPNNPSRWSSKGFFRDSSTGMIRKIVENIQEQTRNTNILYDQEEIFPVEVINSENQSFKYQYNHFTGKLEQVTDPNGFITQWEYDGFGRELNKTIPGISRRSTDYTWSGQKFCISSRVKGGPEIVQFQDRLGRTTEEFWSTRNTSMGWKYMQYNNQGLLSSLSVPAFSHDTTNDKMKKTYDPMGRILTNEEANGAIYHYKYQGLTTQVIDSNGGITKKIYNKLKQLITVVDAEGGTTSYKYGPFGYLSKIIDNYGNTTKIERNAYGNITRLDDPDSGVVTSEYNGFGEVIKTTDSKGQVHTYSYDMLGRITDINGSDGISKYKYDNQTNGIGSLKEAISPDKHKYKYKYDEFGRLKTILYKYDNNTFYDKIYYDEFGRKSRYVFPTKQDLDAYYINYVYDEFGFVNKIIDPSGKVIWESIKSNQVNQVTEEHLGNGLTTKRMYDQKTFLIQSIQTTNSLDELQNIQHGVYRWDKMHNLVYRYEEPLQYAESIQYDKLNRAVEIHTSIDPNVKNEDVIKNLTIRYDHTGNILAKTDIGDYSYSPEHPHAVVKAGSLNYSYDVKGNMISCPAGDLAYKSFNKPASLSKNGQLVNNYSYDAFNNRIKKTIYSHNQEKEVVNYINNISQFIRKKGEKPIYRYSIDVEGRPIAKIEFKGSIDPSTYSIQYLHLNHQGSPIARTDINGDLLKLYSYDAFGRSTKPTWPFNPNKMDIDFDYGYTGHKNDTETQMIDMGGRIYDPVIARFTTPDPFIQNQYHSQSLNRYSYVYNNPLSLIDPTGYQAETSPEPEVDYLQETHVNFEAVTLIAHPYRTIKKSPQTVPKEIPERNNGTSPSDNSNSGAIFDYPTNLPAGWSIHTYNPNTGSGFFEFSPEKFYHFDLKSISQNDIDEELRDVITQLATLPLVSSDDADANSVYEARFNFNERKVMLDKFWEPYWSKYNDNYGSVKRFELLARKEYLIHYSIYGMSHPEKFEFSKQSLNNAVKLSFGSMVTIGGTALIPATAPVWILPTVTIGSVGALVWGIYGPDLDTKPSQNPCQCECK